MSVHAAKWECGRCRVSFANVDGRQAALPTGWTEAEGKSFCLSCSRALAGDAATDAAPADSSRQDLVRLRRSALIEFEIRRAPETPNQTIARSCRTSTGAVTAVRAAIKGVPAAS